MCSKYVIEARNVWKVYGEGETRVEALRGVDLKIEKGDLVSVVGPSGCGKTTLLNCLGGLDRVTKGEIIVNGIEITSLSDKELVEFRRKHIGFVFQFFNLLPEFTALENVMIPMIASNFSKEEALERAKELLKDVGLERRMNHYPYQLSGGEMQRVAVARALANKPSVVLMDEPTGNLDSKSAMMLMELIRKLNEENKQTFVIVTHSKMIAKNTYRIYEMLDGKIKS
jgi:ABC-type lipoprotein export system ATPase subunit